MLTLALIHKTTTSIVITTISSFIYDITGKAAAPHILNLLIAS